MNISRLAFCQKLIYSISENYFYGYKNTHTLIQQQFFIYISVVIKHPIIPYTLNYLSYLFDNCNQNPFIYLNTYKKAHTTEVCTLYLEH